MDDEVYATHTHVARVRVIETVKGFYRGFVYLRRIGDDPESGEQHQTERNLHGRFKRGMPRALLPANCSKSTSSGFMRRRSELRRQPKHRK